MISVQRGNQFTQSQSLLYIITQRLVHERDIFKAAVCFTSFYLGVNN